MAPSAGVFLRYGTPVMTFFQPPPTLAHVRQITQPVASFWQRRGPEIQQRAEDGLVLTVATAIVIGMAIAKLMRWIRPWLSAALLELGRQLTTPEQQEELAQSKPQSKPAIDPVLPAFVSEKPTPPRAKRTRSSAAKSTTKGGFQ